MVVLACHSSISKVKREQENQEIKVIPQLHRRLEASLGYMILGLKQTKVTTS